FAPLLLGFACHGVCLRWRLLAGLGRPIDRGRTFRGRPLFGANKTWRGVAAVGLGAALGIVLLRRGLSASPVIDALPRGAGAPLLGFAMGAVAMLAELPNSFAKRQLEIAPGTQARGVTGAVFHVIDQIDVLLGAWLVLWPFVHPSAGLLLASAAFV